MSQGSAPVVKATPRTAIQYVLSRLKNLGITDVFGVPGDYAFPINDAICADKDMRFIGSCNEVNAAYSADGYARVKGLGAINPTYGPGELNAIGGIAGAYAEHVPIFHLTALPSRELQRTGRSCTTPSAMAGSISFMR